MRGLRQAAILAAPALASALSFEADDSIPSALINLHLPPELEEPPIGRSLTLRLGVLESQAACGYGNVTVNGQSLEQGENGVGSGSVTTDQDNIVVATWNFSCVSWNDEPREQLMSFNVDYIDGKEIQDVGFTVRFQQTAPVWISDIEGSASMTRVHKLGQPREGFGHEEVDHDLDMEVAELEILRMQLVELKQQIFMKEKYLSEAFGWKEDPAITQCDSLKCLFKSVYGKVKGAVGGWYDILGSPEDFDGEPPFPHPHGSKGKHGKHDKHGKWPHHGPPHHGNQTHGGNHTRPHPPFHHRPPPFCHCPPPPHHGPGKGEDHPPPPPHGRPGKQHRPPPPPHDGPEFDHPPPPPHHGPEFDHPPPPPPPFPPHGPGKHHGPPPPPPHDGPEFDHPPAPPHHGPEFDHPPSPPHPGPGEDHPPPPPPPHKDVHERPGNDFDPVVLPTEGDKAERPMSPLDSEAVPPPPPFPHHKDDSQHGAPGHERRPHDAPGGGKRPPPGNHGGHPHPPPPSPFVDSIMRAAPFVKVIASIFILALLIGATHTRCCRHARQSREERRAGRQSKWSAFLARLGLRHDEDDEEKQAMLRRIHENDSDNEDDNMSTTMEQELVQFRNAADVVSDMVAAEEGRSNVNSDIPMTQVRIVHEMQAVPVPPSPTSAFPDYMAVDEALPAYDDSQVSDGFRYSPGNSVYTPSVSDSGSSLDENLGRKQ